MSHWRVLVLCVPAVVATVAAAACGGGGEEKTSPTPDVQATETATAAQEQAAAATAEAEALNATATAEAFAPTATATAEARRQPSIGQSRENPVPLGQSGSVVDRLEAKVISVNMDAWPLVQAENSFNGPPEPGKRMVLVILEVTDIGSDSLDVGFEPTYGLVGDKAVGYDTFDPSCGLIPDDLGGELFPGGVKQGNVCFQVDTDDTNLILFVEMFTADFDRERLFLALQ